MGHQVAIPHAQQDARTTITILERHRVYPVFLAGVVGWKARDGVGEEWRGVRCEVVDVLASAYSRTPETGNVNDICF